MKVSPILQALARHYESTQAGRTGVGERDLILDYEEFLLANGCRDGDSRAVAEADLRLAAKAGVLTLVPHRRDNRLLEQLRFNYTKEPDFYRLVGSQSPTERRRQLAAQFRDAVTDTNVPARWRSMWEKYWLAQAEAAMRGDTGQPFDREASPANAKLLTLIPKLLAWNGESLVRFVSCVLCGESKELEALAAMEREGEFSGQLRGKLGRLLEDITGGEIRSLDDLGILPNPRSVLVHGPLRLCVDGEWLDLGRLQGSFRLSQIDIERAQELSTTAQRCLTVENETSFHELAKLRSGELLIQTSYPGSGTLALLRRLPVDTDFWHFGDSDNAGFDILRDLRSKSGRDFQPLHMSPNQIPFEQEALGRPNLSSWPYYA